MKARDIPILMYHDIDTYEKTWCITPTQFESQLKYLQDHNYHAITMQELHFLLKVDGELPQNCVAITFDDARLGVYKNALPLLIKYGMKATLFVVSDWVQDHATIPSNERYSEFMTTPQVQSCINQGWEIGSHSKTHSKLPALTDQDYYAEIVESKNILESLFRTKIASYGYPYGQTNPEVVELVKKTYASAITTLRGFDKTSHFFARQWITPDLTSDQFIGLLTKKTLSIAMIVKDEEAFLPACLSSIRSMADEIIIVDTGSTDKTISIAKQYQANIIEIPWEQDFSLARNQSLLHATKDWVFILDADEEIDQHDLPLILDAIHTSKTDAYQFVTYNYTRQVTLSNFIPIANQTKSKGFPGYIPSLKVRLIKNHHSYHFSGAVHELLEPSILASNGIITLCPVPIHHYGELKNNTSSKLNLHLELNKTKVEQDPKNEKALFDLAIQYKLTHKYQDAINALLLLLERSPLHILSQIELGICYTKLKKYTLASAAYQRAATQILKNHAQIQENPLSNQTIALNDQKNTLGSQENILKGKEHTLNNQEKKYLCEIYFGLGYIELQTLPSPAHDSSDSPDSLSPTTAHHTSSSAIHGLPTSTIQDSPTSHSTNNNLHYIEAKSYFEKALTQNPLHLLARINLAATHTYLHEYSKAIANLKYVLASHPTNQSALFNLAVAYEKQQNLHLAKEYYLQAHTAGHPHAQKYANKITAFLEQYNSSIK